MKSKVKYSDQPIGKLRVVDDFLPPPEDLVFKEENVKVTMSLSRASVNFFKNEAKKNHTSYQLMIRKLVDIYASQFSKPITWNKELIGSIAYLGIGASVISFLCWNAAIARIGSVRTSLFGNLIPIISTLEAVWLLGEEITYVHAIAGALVIAGLFLANIQPKKPALT